MNNSRYVREIDFARVDFYERTNLYRTIVAKGGSVVQGATTIRYRRFIRPFRCYKITSKIIYWDSQTVFMEHRFICPVDGFIHCVAICRQRFLNVTATEVMDTLLTKCKHNLDKMENGEVFKCAPEMPMEVDNHISIKQSTHFLRHIFCCRF